MTMAQLHIVRLLGPVAYNNFSRGFYCAKNCAENATEKISTKIELEKVLPTVQLGTSIWVLLYN